MTLPELRDRIVERGIEESKKTETIPYKLQGCLDGFEICRKLTSIEDFESEVRVRELELQSIRDDISNKKKTREDYFRFRCATAQIEWTLEVLKVGCPERYERHSVRAARLYAEIVGVKEI